MLLWPSIIGLASFSLCSRDQAPEYLSGSAAPRRRGRAGPSGSCPDRQADDVVGDQQRHEDQIGAQGNQRDPDRPGHPNESEPRDVGLPLGEAVKGVNDQEMPDHGTGKERSLDRARSCAMPTRADWLHQGALVNILSRGIG